VATRWSQHAGKRQAQWFAATRKALRKQALRTNGNQRPSTPDKNQTA
jgi:hypothetical protein